MGGLTARPPSRDRGLGEGDSLLGNSLGISGVGATVSSGLRGGYSASMESYTSNINSNSNSNSSNSLHAYSGGPPRDNRQLQSALFPATSSSSASSTSSASRRRRQYTTNGGRADAGDDDDEDDDEAFQGLNKNALKVFGIVMGFTVLALVVLFYFLFFRNQPGPIPLYRHKSQFGPQFLVTTEDVHKEFYPSVWVPSLTLDTFQSTLRSAAEESSFAMLTHTPAASIGSGSNGNFTLQPLEPSTTGAQPVLGRDAAQQGRSIVPLKRYFIVEFYAHWCGHCRRFAKHMERLGQAFNGDALSPVRAFKLNCAGPGVKICDAYGVRGYPSMMWADAALWMASTESLVASGFMQVPEDLRPEPMQKIRTAEDAIAWVENKLKDIATKEHATALETGSPVSSSSSSSSSSSATNTSTGSASASPPSSLRGPAWTVPYNYTLLSDAAFDAHIADKIASKKAFLEATAAAVAANNASSASSSSSSGAAGGTTQGTGNDPLNRFSAGYPANVNAYDANLYLSIALRESVTACTKKMRTPFTPDPSAAALAASILSPRSEPLPLASAVEQDSKLLASTSCYEALHDWVGWLCHLHVDASCRPSLCRLYHSLHRFVPTPPPEQILGLGKPPRVPPLITSVPEMSSSSSLSPASSATESLERGWQLCDKPWSAWSPEAGADWRQCKGSLSYTRGYTCGLWLLLHSTTFALADNESTVGVVPRETLRVAGAGSGNVDSLPSIDEPAVMMGEAVEYVESPSDLPTDNSIIYTSSGRKPLSLALASTTTSTVASSSPSVLASQLTRSLRAYLYHYFLCDECQQHFLKYSRGLDEDLQFGIFFHNTSLTYPSRTYAVVAPPIPQTAGPAGPFAHPSAQLALWLWDVHNSVNDRLSTVETEHNVVDPAFPKRLFPSYLQCPQCYVRQPCAAEEAATAGAAAGAAQTPTDGASRSSTCEWTVEWRLPVVWSFLKQFYTTPSSAGLS